MKTFPSSRIPLFCLLSTAALFCTTLAAQDRPPAAPQEPTTKAVQKDESDKTPVFKSQVRTVLVPVVVKDKKNQHVAGLTKADFTILENGKPQLVASVTEIQAGNNAEAISRAANFTPSQEGFEGLQAVNIASNESGGVESHKRLLIVVLDYVNTEITDQQNTREQVVKFLTTKIKNDTMVELIIFSSGGVRVLHDFTQDTQLLVAALKRDRMVRSKVDNSMSDPSAPQDLLGAASSRTTPALSESVISLDNPLYTSQQNTDRAALTYSSFEQVAQRFVGVPGHKSLVWVTSGFPNRWAMTDLQSVNTPDAEQFAHMMHLLNDAGIAVYPVDARGMIIAGGVDYSNVRIRVDGDIGSVNSAATQASIQATKTAGAQLSAIKDVHDEMNDIADNTGGHAYYNTNDITGAMDAAANDATSYYLLSFVIDPSDRKPGWRRLRVKVDRSGADVRARNGFYYMEAGKDSAAIKSEDIKTALVSPFNYTSIAVRAAITGVHDSGSGKREVTYRLILPTGSMTIDDKRNNYVDMDIAYLVSDAQGNQVDHQDLAYTMKLVPRSVDKVVQKGSLYEHSFKVAPGQYSVRFVVRDNLSGRMGSVEIPLKVN